MKGEERERDRGHKQQGQKIKKFTSEKYDNTSISANTNIPFKYNYYIDLHDSSLNGLQRTEQVFNVWLLNTQRVQFFC